MSEEKSRYSDKQSPQKPRQSDVKLCRGEDRPFKVKDFMVKSGGPSDSLFSSKQEVFSRFKRQGREEAPGVTESLDTIINIRESNSVDTLPPINFKDQSQSRVGFPDMHRSQDYTVQQLNFGGADNLNDESI